jgi:hydrogenase maturation protease
MLVIGLGNPYRGDDGVGPVVARAMADRALESVTVLEHSGEGAGLAEMWAGMDMVILVDAVSSGGTPGTVHRLDARATPIPVGLLHHSSHAFGVAEAVELARALGRLPPRLLVYGVVGMRFALGRGLTGAVEEAVSGVVDCIVRDVQAVARRTG